MAEILSFDRFKKVKGDNPLKKIWEFYSSQPKFIKFTIIIFALIILVTPIIITTYQIFRPKAVGTVPFPEGGSSKIEQHVLNNHGMQALLATDTTFYLGGHFSAMAYHIQGGVVLDTTTGIRLTPYDKLELNTTTGRANVLAVVPDGTGGWYIGGYFDKVGGVARTNLAHIRADRTLDPNFNPTFDSCCVSTLALSPDGTKLFVTGDFISVNGQSRNKFAVLNTSDGSLTSTDLNIVGNPSQLALSADGTILYIGGSFTSVNGQPRNNLTAVNSATGELVTSFNPAPNSGVNVLKLSHNGSILYTAGSFTTISGQTRNKFAAIDTATGNVTSLNPVFSSSIFPVEGITLSPDDTIIYLGGQFTSVNGEPRQHLAALKASDGSLTSLDIVVDSAFSGISTSNNGNTLYIGGGFNNAGGQPRRGLAAIDLTTNPPTVTSWYPNQQDPTIANTIYSLAISPDDSQIYVAGDINTFGGVTRGNVASIDSTTNTITSFNPTTSNDYVRDLAISADKSTLYLGGAFTTIGSQPRSQLGAVDAVTGVPTPWTANLDGGVVYELELDGTTLYVAGYFFGISRQPRTHLAAVNTVDGSATSLNPNLNDFVGTMALSPDKKTLYVGGAFTTISGQTRNHLAAIDLTTNPPTVTSFNPDINGNVWEILVSPDGKTIYIGGEFTAVGGQTRNYIAAININPQDAAYGTLTSFNPNPNYTVWDLELTNDGTVLYIGGKYDQLGGVPIVSGLTGVDATTGELLWNPTVDLGGNAVSIELSPDNNKLFIGGCLSVNYYVFVATPPSPTPTPTPPTNTPTPTPTPTPPSGPTSTPTPTPPSNPTPTPTPGQNNVGSNPTPTPTSNFVPVVPKNPPKTGHNLETKM